MAEVVQLIFQGIEAGVGGIQVIADISYNIAQQLDPHFKFKEQYKVDLSSLKKFQTELESLMSEIKELIDKKQEIADERDEESVKKLIDLYNKVITNLKNAKKTFERMLSYTNQVDIKGDNSKLNELKKDIKDRIDYLGKFIPKVVTNSKEVKQEFEGYMDIGLPEIQNAGRKRKHKTRKHRSSKNKKTRKHK